jgi:hypothetical protein
VLELQEGAAARAEVRIAPLMKELDEDRELARKINQPSAAIAPTMGKAKLAGLLVERKALGKPGKFENMSIDELREYIVRESRKLGISVGLCRLLVLNAVISGKLQPPWPSSEKHTSSLVGGG